MPQAGAGGREGALRAREACPEEEAPRLPERGTHAPSLLSL